MKLKELKQGMVGKLRNKESITVVNSRHYFTSGHLMFALEKKYNDDLKHKENKNLDIMEITFGDKVVFKRKEKEDRWFVPEVGEWYYFSNHPGEVVSNKNIQDIIDENIFNTAKIFKTKEEAEKRARQERATLSVERWIAENDVEVDVYDFDVLKCSLCYDVEAKEFGVMSSHYFIYAPKQFILSSEEKVKQLFKEREKEIKIMFGVEE